MNISLSNPFSTKKITLLIALFLILVKVQLFAQSPFITTWKTDNGGASNNTSITIPTIGTDYLYDVDWDNDGTYDEKGLKGDATHNYGAVGTYTVAIRGTFPRIYFNYNNDDDKEKLLNVKQWGTNAWSSMNSAFMGCSNLSITAKDVPNLTNVTSISYMFNGCSKLNGPTNIGSWNVSAVTDMSGTFSVATAFNQDISAWNVSEVRYMYAMFQYASTFNQKINSWNVSKVINMAYMFSSASAFNQNIGSLNVSAVADMNAMFSGAHAFNQSLAPWGKKFNAKVALNNFLDNCGMGTANYDATLTGFNSGSVKGFMGAAGRKYSAALADRAHLVLSTLKGGQGWTILGDSLLTTPPSAVPPFSQFVTTLKTNNAEHPNKNSVTIPTIGSGYLYDVDWNNDGIFDQFGLRGDVTHNYGTAGTYPVTIRGMFPRIYFNTVDDSIDKMASLDETDHSFAVYPNPTTAKIKVDFLLQKDENVWFNLYDLQGKNFHLNNFEGKIGRNIVELDLQNYPVGTYFVDLNYNQKREVRKVLKVN